MCRPMTFIVAALALCGRPMLGAERAAALHTLASFESEQEATALLPGEGRVRVSLAREHATQGESAARLSFPPYNPRGGNWPSIALLLGRTPGAVTDWTPYRRIELDVVNPVAEEREFGISFVDQDGKSAGYSYWKVPASGRRTIWFDLSRLAGEIDCSRMQKILFWQRLHLRRPKDRTEFFIDYVRLVPKVLDAKAVSIWIVEPHFRGAVYATNQPNRIRAEVRLGLPPRAGIARAVAALIGPDGKTRGSAALRLDDKPQTVEFPYTRVPAGQHLILRVTLVDGTGKKLHAAETRIPVRPPAKDEVTVDAQNRLLVNGRPFFPIGIYNASLDDLGLLAKMGFNCAGPYLKATADYMAEAKKHGLRLISNAPAKDDTWQRAAADSGTLLGYYMYDEPAPERADDLRERCRALAKAAPYHPTCGCNNLHYAYYTDAADIMMVDAYPHPGKFDVIVKRLQAAVPVMQGRRPVWYIPQAFARMGYMHARSTWENSREPTYDELRAATWLGIALGARGIVFYSHRIQTFKIRYAYPLLWRALGYTVRELRALHEVMLWPRAPVQSSAKGVYARAFVSGERVLVVAANAGEKSVEATLSSQALPASTLRVVGEQRTVDCQDGRFRDKFPPRTAHLYANWPVASGVDVNKVRAALAAAWAERARKWERNVALFYRGATLEASWGFPKDVRAYPWQWMIDGYRGTAWPLGARGLLGRKFRYPTNMRGPNRWIEVRLAAKAPLEEAVVVTAGVHYRFAVNVDGQWRVIEPSSAVQTTEYADDPPRTVRTFPLNGIESDRVRLILPDPPRRGERKFYHEIEVYRANK